jgi:hypothetical protein
MERVLLTLLLSAVFALACSSGKTAMPRAEPATPATPANPAEPAKPAEPPAASAACDYKVVAMSDPAQKQIQCGNGESFVVRRGDDGKWYEEMKVRAGTRPGYATPNEAAKARCCGAAG